MAGGSIYSRGEWNRSATSVKVDTDTRDPTPKNDAKFHRTRPIDNKSKNSPTDTRKDTFNRITPAFNRSRSRSRTMPSKLMIDTGVQNKLFQDSEVSLATVESDITTSPADFSDSGGSEPVQSAAWVFTDILHSFGEKDRPAGYVIRRSNELVSLLEQNPSLKDDLVLHSILHKIQNLLLSPNSNVVACGYRILRYVITSSESLKMFERFNLSYFIVASLSKDPANQTEREEGLKLLRKFIDTEGGIDLLDLGSVKALVAVIESTEDPLRKASVETLCEISLLDPDIAYKANGIGVLLQCILDGAKPVVNLCLVTITQLLNSPISRRYVLAEKTVEMLISPFMDVSHVKLERLQNMATVLNIVLNTWPGLMAFSQNDCSALKQLISCLMFDSSPVRSVLIQLFFGLFRIRRLPWVVQQVSSTESALLLGDISVHPAKASVGRSNPEKEASLINHYTSLLLYACCRCSLIDRLTEIYESQSADKRMQKKTIILLSEISYLESTLIPDAIAKDIFPQPSFELNRLLDRDIRKHHKTGILPQSFQQRALRTERREVLQTTAAQIMMATDVDSDGLTVMTQSNVKMLFIESTHGIDIKNLITGTRVLLTKEYSKWDWNLVIQIMQGPLRNAKMFDDVVKTTKFYKRLLSFYRPFKYRFSALKPKGNQIYVRAGCEIFENLLSHNEGIKYLSENKLLPQIAECLAQVDPYSGITAQDPLFSAKNLQSTLSSYYFKFLGILSDNAEAIRMLEQWWIFDMLYHITDRKSNRDDLVHLILTEMKYRLPGHMRMIISKVASTGSRTSRIEATKVLGELLSEDDVYESMACHALVNQLCDPDTQVSDIAVQALTAYARDPSHVDNVIRYHPSLDSLGSTGTPLLQALFTTPTGFTYLKELNFVESEMEAWLEHKNMVYVKDTERFVSRRMFDLTNVEASQMPYHFFGALVKTSAGVDLLDSSGSFDTFAAPIQAYGKMIADEEELMFYQDNQQEEIDNVVLQLKAALWAVGNVGSTENGISLLEISGLIDEVNTILVKSLNLSLRGTCFFVFGLIAQTDQGLEILDDLGWCTKRSSLGEDLPICLPRSSETFFNLCEQVTAQKLLEGGGVEEFERIMEEDFIPYSENQHHIEHNSPSSTVAGVIGSSSYVTSKYSEEYLVMYEIYENLNLVVVNQAKAYSNLNKLKTRFPNLFKTEPVVLKFIMQILEFYRAKTPVRRHLLIELVDFNRMMEVLLRRSRKKLREPTVVQKNLVPPSLVMSSVSIPDLNSAATFRTGSSVSPTPSRNNLAEEAGDGNRMFTSIYRNRHHHSGSLSESN